MRKVIILTFLGLMCLNIGFSQEEKSVEKTIIIKKMGEDGNYEVTTLSNDDFTLLDNYITVDDLGDSIIIDMEMEMGDVKPQCIKMKNKHHKLCIGSHDKWMNGKKGSCHDFKNYAKCCPKKNSQRDDKPQLGVYIEDDEKGVKVTEVIANSSAYSVGLMAGDVITKINGKKMTNAEELVREVGAHKPGDMIEIKFKRNGKGKKVSARLQGSDNGALCIPHPGCIKGEFEFQDFPHPEIMPMEFGPEIHEEMLMEFDEMKIKEDVLENLEKAMEELELEMNKLKKDLEEKKK